MLENELVRVGTAALGTFPLVALAATINGATREIVYKRRLGRDVAHPLCASIDVVCFSALANRMLTGLEAKLQQPRGLPTRQLVLIGAIWAGCIAALEAALGRLARPSPAAADPGAVPPSAAAGATAAATSSSSAPAAVPAQQPRQVGAGGAGEMRQGSQPGMQQPASVPPPAGSTSGASLRRPRSSSFWEDGRAFPYLVAVMAAVPVVVGWVRRWSRT